MTTTAPVTIRDVAALAGVSQATASRVLSGSPATSPDSRARVLAAAADLDFRPNAQARSLRSTRTQTLGLLISDVRNPFFADLAHAVEQAALDNGYVTLLGNANESTDQQDRYLDTFISQRVDGVIAAPQGAGGGSLRALLERNIPTVFVDRTVEGIDVPSVTTDGRAGIREAVEHLAGGGHRRIGYIAGPQTTSTGRQRLEAYVEAVADYGLDEAPELIFSGDFRSASGSAGAEHLLHLDNPPTAIVAADSPMAIGAVAAMRRLGMTPGEDVALIAFDDIEWFSLLDPALTAISHDVGAMGRAAVGMLLQVIDGRRPGSVRLPSHLVVRESSVLRRATGGRGLSPRGATNATNESDMKEQLE
ncbi:MAG: LacI family transcriptional regulator [Arthrobacter pascens]|nr:LacI family transcriptional regulator [Arthrobacter pascens]